MAGSSFFFGVMTFFGTPWTGVFAPAGGAGVESHSGFR